MKKALFICGFLLFAAQPVWAGHHGGEEMTTLSEVVVTAEKISEYIKNHPQRVVALDRTEIEERNFLDTGEALNSMAGVDVKDRGAGSGASISIRGSGKGGGVLVLINGRPLNSSQYGSVNLNNIPIDMVQRITVYKPPVPVWLGAGASEGAVNIETRSSETEKVSDSKNKHTLKFTGGSFGLAKANYSVLMPREDGSVMLTAAATHRDGKRVNSERDSGSFSFHWDRQGENLTKYEVNGRFYTDKHGSPGPNHNLTPDANQRYTKGALDLQTGGMAGATGEYSLKAFADWTDIEDRAQSGLESDLEVTKLGLKGERTWSDPDGTWALRFGGQAQNEEVDHTLTGNHHRDSVSLNTQIDKEFGKVSTSLGLRGDYTSDFDLAPAFTTGVSYELGPKMVLKANAGYTVNVPSFGQLYQTSHGSIDQTRGNPDLEEEKIWAYDLGIEHRLAKGRVFQATLFRSDYRDQIIWVEGNDLIKRPQNTSSSWRHGVELSLKYQLTDSVDLDFSYIWQDSENKDADGYLTYTPRHKGKITAKTVLGSGTRVEAILRAVSSQYSDPENSEERKLDSYAAVDLKMIHPVTLKTMPAEFYLNVFNLFDTDYESHYGYPDDGLRFMAGVKMKF